MSRKRTLVDQVDNAFEHIADWSIRHRALVIVLALLLVGGGLYFAAKARADNSMDAYFDKDDPTYVAYLDYLDTFLSDEVSYILYRVPGSPHGPFDLEAMKKIAHLTTTFENEVPFIREATSLANVEFMHADGDDLVVDELLIDFPKTQEALLKVKQSVMAKPMYVGYLIDPTGEYGAIFLEMDRTSTDTLDRIIYDPAKGEALDNLYPQVSDAVVREILSRPEYAGIDFFITGDVAMNSAYNHVITSDAAYIMLATLVIAALLSLVLFRVSWAGLLAPITVVLMSVVLTVAFIGLVGWKIGLFFSMVPSLLCAVGIAQSVHILLEYQRALAETGERNQAVKAALKKVGGPCLMAALTTAAGFLVMSVSQLEVLRQFAFYASAGVIMTFVLSATLLVVFLAGKTTKPSDRKMAVNPWIMRGVRAVIALNLRHQRSILLAFLLLGVGALIGVSKLTIDFNFMTEFKPHMEWRQHSEKAEEIMGGLLNVTYIIDTQQAEGVKNAELMAAIDRLQTFASQKPLVKKSFSMVDIVKDLNRSFHGDDDRYYKLPDSNQLLAQLLLVYEVSGGDELWEMVSLDFSRTVLEMRVEIADASEVSALVASIDNYLATHPLPGAEVRQTGIGLMWIKIAEYIADTQLASYSLVFIIVAIFMSLTFGSLKVGLLSMIPNLTPVVMILGFMGWMDIHLDYMKLLLATIAIGIAVDDTIHLVTRYRKRFYELGNYQQAMAASLTDVGPALMITSIILVASFSSFLFSNMSVLSSFGMLLGGSISAALLADLLLMPALIQWLKPFGEEFAVAPQAGSEVPQATA